MVKNLEDFVVFEKELPEELVEELNSSYGNIDLTDDKLILTRPKLVNDGEKEKIKDQPRQQHKMYAFCVVLFLIPIFTLMMLLGRNYRTIAGSEPLMHHSSSEMTGHTAYGSIKDSSNEPIELSRNLALKSEGAYMLQGYTSSPAYSRWWSWSSVYRADPECLIKPLSVECWPMMGESAVGIGLEHPSVLNSVKVDLSIELASSKDTVAVTVYEIDAAGNLTRIGRSGFNSTEVAIKPGIVSSLVVIRTQILREGTIVSRVGGCIRSLEVWGIPLREKRA